MATHYYYALGRRKSATASIRLVKGSGKININDKEAKDYVTTSSYLLNRLNKPFNILEIENKYDVNAKVHGGGITGQIDAVSLGIAKALVVMNADFRPTLKKAELLGRDPREKERKKFGLKGARKQRQFTKR